MIEWGSLLRDASSRVQELSDRFAGTSKGITKVGQGAGGDKTLLVDMEAEKAALAVFSDVKDLRVITEERGEFGPRDARWTLILDPVDGSSNFERGIPFYCTSLAVLDGHRLKNAKYALVRNLANGEV
jgi:myo-inositol-1(or 4)-monophosphatase